MHTLADLTFSLIVVPLRGSPLRDDVADENARGTVRRSIMLPLVKQVWLARGTPQLDTVLEWKWEGMSVQQTALSRHAPHRFSERRRKPGDYLPKRNWRHLRRYR